jgi:hypothetical protein
VSKVLVDVVGAAVVVGKSVVVGGPSVVVGDTGQSTSTDHAVPAIGA